jgi:hypothetical protein
MENENVKGEQQEAEVTEFLDGEFCAGCGKPIWLDAHVYFYYSAIAYIYDRVQMKTLDVDVAWPKSAGGSLTFCYDCSTSGLSPYIDAALLRRIVTAAKTLEKESATGSKSLWQKARGLAARLFPN